MRTAVDDLGANTACCDTSADQSRPAARPTTTASDQLPTGSPTILLADDDPSIRALVAHHLRKAGYDVLIAEDGPQVFEVIEHHTPTLFLLDGDMPGLTGFEVCERLNADPRFHEQPVIFLTGLTGAEDVVRGFDVGGTDYVRKPVIAPELLARIRTHIELAENRAAAKHRADLLVGITEEQGQRLDEVRVGQEQLLTSPADFPDYKLAVQFRPAHVAGGDFYEFKHLSDDEVALFVADVSGHDLSMPFITGALKALTASFLSEALTPQETMIQLNASLTRFLAEGRFVSACYARFSRSRMVVDLTSAGHPYPLYQRAGELPDAVEVVGDVLGMFEMVRFDTKQLKVERGDRLFLFTDGLTEGFPDESGQNGSALRGQTLLRECLGERNQQTIQALVKGTVDGLSDRCGNQIEDDIVLMGIEF